MRILLLLLFLCSKVYAQHVYQVYFDSKNELNFSINHPEVFLSQKAIERKKKWNIVIDETDFPIKNIYVNELTKIGCEIVAKTKWLNGATIKIKSKSIADSIKTLPFVKSIEYLGHWKPINKEKVELKLDEELLKSDTKMDYSRQQQFDSNFYGKAYGQAAMLNAHKLHQLGYKGQGVTVGVIDAGFKNVHQIELFKHLFNQKQLTHTFDFVQHNQEVFLDDDHGTAVLSCMAGFLPNEFVGTAPAANYVLLRSEYAPSEMPIEEYYWIEAIEYADSMGVDLVNSSLGYNEFDDKAQNHFYKELNGKKVAISKAANMAVAKGMTVIVSSGNEGDLEWKHICVPADAENVITVGGVDEAKSYAAFSSIGPTADKRIKPDIVAQGDNVWVVSNKGVLYQGDGTSYAAPIAAGAIACLMQAHPDKMPSEISMALKLSSSKYQKPDLYLGYGVPDMLLAHQLLQNDTIALLLDARRLNDKRIHVCATLPADQKVLLTIKDELGKEVLQDQIQFKKGWNRVLIKKSNQLPKGMYSLHFQSSILTASTQIQLN